MSNNTLLMQINFQMNFDTSYSMNRPIHIHLELTLMDIIELTAA